MTAQLRCHPAEHQASQLDRAKQVAAVHAADIAKGIRGRQDIDDKMGDAGPWTQEARWAYCWTNCQSHPDIPEHDDTLHVRRVHEQALFGGGISTSSDGFILRRKRAGGEAPQGGGAHSQQQLNNMKIYRRM